METNIIINADCLEYMRTLPDCCIDSIVTDPPYELGFMGKSWDSTGIANSVEMWKECLRILKPGGHLLAFSGTRTYHRMASAIEDARFEVRDMIEWVYGSGFPKSLNIGKAVDKLQGNEREVIGKVLQLGSTNNRIAMGNGWQEEPGLTKGTSEWEGWGTALKPAHEPICMARKPLEKSLTVAENCLRWGTGGINIDGSRVGTEVLGGGTMPDLRDVGAMSKEATGIDKLSFGQNARPATRKEQPTYTGRFPANLIHDNSEEVRECFSETKSGKSGIRTSDGFNNGVYGEGMGIKAGQNNGEFGDSGNASRFFKSIIYQSKASKSERNEGCGELEERSSSMLARQTTKEGIEQGFGGFGAKPMFNNHPTVKPIALMEYLIKMVTPNGGIVFDPFTGSGSTGVACVKNGFGFIGTDMTAEYCEISRARLNHAIKAREEKQPELFNM